MSKITHVVDAAEIQKGKGGTTDKPKKQAKGQTPAADGEDVKLSKSERNKLLKKEKKEQAKQNAKDGIVTEKPQRPQQQQKAQLIE